MFFFSDGIRSLSKGTLCCDRFIGNLSTSQSVFLSNIQSDFLKASNFVFAQYFIQFSMKMTLIYKYYKLGFKI